MTEPAPARELRGALARQVVERRAKAERALQLVDVEEPDVFRGLKLHVGHEPGADRQHEATQDRLDLPVEVVVVLLGERSDRARDRERVLETCEIVGTIA